MASRTQLMRATRMATRGIAAAASSLASSSGVGIAGLEHVCGNHARLFRPSDASADARADDPYVLELCRERARNAIGREMLDDVECAVDICAQAEGAQAPRALLVCSTVPGIFSAGADLKERRGMCEFEASRFVDRLRATFQRFASLSCPTVAAVDGVALGGGLELALACDLRVGGPLLSVALPETRLAIIPGAGGTQRLPLLVGPARAKDLILTGRRVDQQEAWRLGLIDRLAGAEEGGGAEEEGAALAMALAVCRAIGAGGPVAVRAAKRAIDAAAAEGFSLEHEARGYADVLPTSDRREALEAFAQKRDPKFQGR